MAVVMDASPKGAERRERERALEKKKKKNRRRQRVDFVIIIYESQYKSEWRLSMTAIHRRRRRCQKTGAKEKKSPSTQTVHQLLFLV